MRRRARATGGPGEQKCSPGNCRLVRRLTFHCSQETKDVATARSDVRQGCDARLQDFESTAPLTAGAPAAEEAACPASGEAHLCASKGLRRPASIARADVEGWSSTRGRWNDDTPATPWGQKFRPSACVPARIRGPLHSLERLCGCLAQLGLPAVARAAAAAGARAQAGAAPSLIQVQQAAGSEPYVCNQFGIDSGHSGSQWSAEYVPSDTCPLIIDPTAVVR